MNIHRAMLFLADHVQPHPVWYELDPGEGNGDLVVIVPDTNDAELDTFVQKLYCPGDEVFYTAVPNTPDMLLTVPGTPDVFYTAVPQTPVLAPTELVPEDSIELDKREKQHRLDMIKVSLSLLKIQRNEALAKNDKEPAMNVMRSIDLNEEEKLRIERDLEASDNSEEIVKDEIGEDDNNAEIAAPEAEIQFEDDDVTGEIKEEIGEDDDDEENNVALDPICTQCGALFKSKIAVVKHQVEVHKKMLKVCYICGKTCDSQKALANHKQEHRMGECDICHRKFSIQYIKKHRNICMKKLEEQPPGQQHKCMLFDFSSNI